MRKDVAFQMIYVDRSNFCVNVAVSTVVTGRKPKVELREPQGWERDSERQSRGRCPFT